MIPPYDTFYFLTIYLQRYILNHHPRYMTWIIGYLVRVPHNCITFIWLSSKLKVNNSNDSMSFIALNKLKHEAYNMSDSQANLLHSVGCPPYTHPWHSMQGMFVVFLQCVCATSSLGIRIERPLKSRFLCIYGLDFEPSKFTNKLHKSKGRTPWRTLANQEVILRITC
jgi:hypothetical protein